MTRCAFGSSMDGDRLRACWLLQQRGSCRPDTSVHRAARTGSRTHRDGSARVVRLRGRLNF